MIDWQRNENLQTSERKKGKRNNCSIAINHYTKETDAKIILLNATFKYSMMNDLAYVVFLRKKFSSRNWNLSSILQTGEQSQLCRLMVFLGTKPRNVEPKNIAKVKIKHSRPRRIGLRKILGKTMESPLTLFFYSVFRRIGIKEFNSSRGSHFYMQHDWGKFSWFGHCHHYDDGPYGPSCTPVLKNLKLLMS